MKINALLKFVIALLIVQSSFCKHLQYILKRLKITVGHHRIHVLKLRRRAKAAGAIFLIS